MLSDLLWALVWAAPFVVVTGLGVALVWWLLGTGYASITRRQTPRRPRTPAAQIQEMRRSGAYWAVMVQAPPGRACEAIERERSSVFLLHHAPTLPLDDCAHRRCQCGYVGLRERRRRDVLPPDIDDRRAGATVRWYRPAGAPDPHGAPHGAPQSRPARDRTRDILGSRA